MPTNDPAWLLRKTSALLDINPYAVVDIEVPYRTDRATIAFYPDGTGPVGIVRLQQPDYTLATFNAQEIRDLMLKLTTQKNVVSLY